MTTHAPADDATRWALERLGCESLVSTKGLRDGGAPWLVEGTTPDGSTRRAVLRAGQEGVTVRREVAGMTAAANGGLPVPSVLGAREDAAPSLLLIEFVDGSSHLAIEPDRHRLEAAGALAARVFAVDRAGLPDGDLPSVTHPIPLVDFDALRAEAEPQPLLVEAEARLARYTAPDAVGFVHGDLWSGNVLWRGDVVAGLLDWDCVGVGAAGVDLGSLRCDAAMCYGGDAPDAVLAGWEAEAGRPADSVAYWDAVAAMSTPPDISWFADAISGMTGRPDLTAPTLRARRDAFLADALARLG